MRPDNFDACEFQAWFVRELLGLNQDFPDPTDADFDIHPPYPDN